jgi:membrane protein
VPERPLHVRISWTVRDYVKRVWDNSGEDNIFFLAGGIAFNILLAAIPLMLLLVTGLAYFLDQTPDASSRAITFILTQLLPAGSGANDAVQRIINDVVRSAPTVTIWSAITFVWFSTRLFGSLRTVLANVFDIGADYGIIAGKLFDAKMTVVATILLAAYISLSAYLAIATTRGVAVLTGLGIRRDVMGGLEYSFGRFIAFAFIALMFFSLYRYLPLRRIRWQTSLVAALFTSFCFELARNLFAIYVSSFNPGSVYRGSIAAVVIVVFWVYYAAIIFILGGEVAQVYELRRVRRQQREDFEV